MLTFTDKSRARYLLEVRANGKYKIWHFIRFNRYRYTFFAVYIPVGIAYFARWGTVAQMLGFIGLGSGLLVGDLSWLRGRNKSWPFTLKTTNWGEVERIAST